MLSKKDILNSRYYHYYYQNKKIKPIAMVLKHFLWSLFFPAFNEYFGPFPCKCVRKAEDEVEGVGCMGDPRAARQENVGVCLSFVATTFHIQYRNLALELHLLFIIFFFRFRSWSTDVWVGRKVRLIDSFKNINIYAVFFSVQILVTSVVLLFFFFPSSWKYASILKVKSHTEEFTS